MEANQEKINQLPETTGKKSGKGPIIALVIVIILALAAVGGTWYYMSNKANKEKQAQEAQIQELQKQVDSLKSQIAIKAVDAQTKDFTTKYDRLKFSYPSNWTLTDTSEASNAEYFNMYGIKGVDRVAIKSQDGFEVSIISGGLGGFACPPDPARKIVSEKVDILGGSYFINYLQKENSNDIDRIFLATKSDQCQSDLSSKNLIVKETGKGAGLSVSATFPNSGSKNMEQIKNSPDLKDFRNLIQSLSY